MNNGVLRVANDDGGGDNEEEEEEEEGALISDPKLYLTFIPLWETLVIGSRKSKEVGKKNYSVALRS